MHIIIHNTSISPSKQSIPHCSAALTIAVSSVGDYDGNANELTTAVSPIGDDDGEDVIKLR